MEFRVAERKQTCILPLLWIEAINSGLFPFLLALVMQDHPVTSRNRPRIPSLPSHLVSRRMIEANLPPPF